MAGIQVKVDLVLRIRAPESRNKLKRVVRAGRQVALVERPGLAAAPASGRHQADIVEGKAAVISVALEDDGGIRDDGRNVDLGWQPGRERCARRQLQVAELNAPECGHGPVGKLTLHLDVGRVGGRRRRKPELQTDGRVGRHSGGDEPGLGLDVDGVKVDIAGRVQPEGVVLQAAKVLGPVRQLPVLGTQVQGAARVDGLPAAQPELEGAVAQKNGGLHNAQPRTI